MNTAYSKNFLIKVGNPRISEPMSEDKGEMGSMTTTQSPDMTESDGGSDYTGLNLCKFYFSLQRGSACSILVDHVDQCKPEICTRVRVRGADYGNCSGVYKLLDQRASWAPHRPRYKKVGSKRYRHTGLQGVLKKGN